MENSITTTLFRFVSLRSPELIERPTRGLLYVSELQQLHSGIFFDAVNTRPPGTSKSEAMAAAAEEFGPLALASEDEIKALNPELYEFSDWLIRNRSIYTNEDLLEKAVGKQPFNDEVGGELQQVWDNLFYQTTSQKSFRLKETLMQLLLADHMIRKIQKDEEGKEHNKMLAQARIALPEVLFDELAVMREPEVLPDGPIVPDRVTKRQLAVSLAETSNKNCQKLKKELQQLEKKYRKDYQEAYDDAYKRYNYEIEPLIRWYNEDLEAARKSFCSRDYRPEFPYNPDDPCQ